MSLYSNNGYYIIGHRIKDVDRNKCIIVYVVFRIAKFVVFDDDFVVVGLSEPEETVGCMVNCLPNMVSLLYHGPEAFQKRPLI